MACKFSSSETSLLSTGEVLGRIRRKSRSTLWRQVHLGQFPKPTVKIADRYPYWSEAIVESFLRGEWRPATR